MCVSCNEKMKSLLNRTLAYVDEVEKEKEKHFDDCSEYFKHFCHFVKAVTEIKTRTSVDEGKKYIVLCLVFPFPKVPLPVSNTEGYYNYIRSLGVHWEDNALEQAASKVWDDWHSHETKNRATWWLNLFRHHFIREVEHAFLATEKDNEGYEVKAFPFENAIKSEVPARTIQICGRVFERSDQNLPSWTRSNLVTGDELLCIYVGVNWSTSSVHWMEQTNVSMCPHHNPRGEPVAPKKRAATRLSAEESAEKKVKQEVPPMPAGARVVVKTEPT